MSITRTPAEIRYDATREAILAEYNATCDKAREQCEAAVDRIKASDADEALKQRRIETAISQMVITQDNADHVRVVALRRTDEEYDRAMGR